MIRCRYWSTPSIWELDAPLPMRMPFVVPANSAVADESACWTAKVKPPAGLPIFVLPEPSTEKRFDLNALPVIDPAPERSMPLVIVGEPLIARIEPVVLSGLALRPSPIWISVPHPTAPDWLPKNRAASFLEPATASVDSWVMLQPYLSRTDDPVAAEISTSPPTTAAIRVAEAESVAIGLTPKIAPFSVPTPPPSLLAAFAQNVPAT